MAMRMPLTAAERELLYQRKHQGLSHRQVAHELGCSPHTIRKYWKAHRLGKPLPVRGRPARGVLSQYPPAVRQLAIAIKQAHPHWGAANVRLELSHQRRCALDQLPSLSRLAVLFRQVCPEAVQARHARPHPVPPSPSGRVHQRWQIDAVERVVLADGQFASVLQIRDPVSAVMLASQAFLTTLSPTRWRKLTLEEIRAVLRSAMARWGRPLEIQTDRETTYCGNNQSDFPSPFSLWLAGLGINHPVSRPGCPTDQAQIERSHRTIGAMTWQDTPFATLAQLQQALDQSCQRYNQELGVHAGHCRGQAPLQVAPWALHTGRPYEPALEAMLFELERVDRLLSGSVFRRKVDQNGVLWLGSATYSLGRDYARQWVQARFVPETRSFAFSTEQDQPIAQRPAKGLSVEALTGLSASAPAVSLCVQLWLPLEEV